MSDPATELESGLDLNAIIRGWKLLVFTTVGMMALGATLLFRIVPLQEVSARIIVERREISSNGIITAVRDREFLPTQAEIVASPAVISGTVDRENPNLRPELKLDRVAKIISGLTVDPLTGTGILLLKYTDVDAQAAAKTMEAIIASYSDYLADTEQQQNLELMAALSARSAELEATLNDLQADYEDLGLLNANAVAADPEATSRIIAALEADLTEAESQKLALERAAQRLNGDPLLAAGDSAIRTVVAPVPGNQDALLVIKELLTLNPAGLAGITDPAPMEERLRIAEDRMSEMSRRFGPDHPEFRAAQSALESAENQLARFTNAAPRTIRESLSFASMRESALRERYEFHVQTAGRHKLNEVKEAQKLEELQSARQAYEAAQAQLKELQLVDEAVKSGQAGVFVSLLEHPTPAPKSFVTNPVIVLGVTGLLGLMGGILLLIGLPALRRLIVQPAMMQPTPGI